MKPVHCQQLANMSNLKQSWCKTARMRRLLLAAAGLVLTTSALSACQTQVQAPDEAGVCWHMVTLEDGKTRFNPLARNVRDIEHCAAALETMRLEFNRLGQSNDEVVGGYQGNFVWLEREGVFISQTLNGSRFPAMVRSGDGRLVITGAVEQPPQGTNAAAGPVAPTGPPPARAVPRDARPAH
jgi:hypothetical protein